MGKLTSGFLKRHPRRRGPTNTSKQHTEVMQLTHRVPFLQAGSSTLSGLHKLYKKKASTYLEECGEMGSRQVFSESQYNATSQLRQATSLTHQTPAKLNLFLKWDLTLSPELHGIKLSLRIWCWAGEKMKGVGSRRTHKQLNNIVTAVFFWCVT